MVPSGTGGAEYTHTLINANGEDIEVPVGAVTEADSVAFFRVGNSGGQSPGSVTVTFSDIKIVGTGPPPPPLSYLDEATNAYVALR